jgi:hypothetical protein
VADCHLGGTTPDPRSSPDSLTCPGLKASVRPLPLGVGTTIDDVGGISAAPFPAPSVRDLARPARRPVPGGEPVGSAVALRFPHRRSEDVGHHQPQRRGE